MTAQLGQLGQRLRQAIMLQSSRVGTEFVCQQCRQGFIYTRVDMPTVTFGQAQPATQKVG
ncbi:MAG: hypothetical protein R3C01_03620 [Planctomycetaceae bacterium]